MISPWGRTVIGALVVCGIWIFVYFSSAPDHDPPGSRQVIITAQHTPEPAAAPGG